MSETSYIPDHIADDIKKASDLLTIAQETMPELKRAGASYKTDCPVCKGKMKLHITPAKDLFKCFIDGCDVHGIGATTFLMRTQNLDYPTALRFLADRYHIEIPKGGEQAFKNHLQGGGKVSFRDLQLKHSGIPLDAQKYMRKVAEGKWIEESRYTSGTMDAGGKYIANGDDMVLHYIGLDESPIMFRPEKAQREIPLLRVRYQHPDLHTNKDGDPIKYRSPRGSGNNLWLPQQIIKAWKTGREIQTLYVVEGEKKSDKMCLHGLDAVGVAGIHNLSLEGDMPRAFEMLVTKCQVKQVVFVLDSDWQDISVKPGKSADQRPRTFFRAVQKFREYFHGFRNSGHDLGIYLCAGRDQAQKGMDDLLSTLEAAGRETIGQSGELARDINEAILDAKGDGSHVQVFKIHPLRMSEYQLQGLWCLDSTHKFIERHQAKLKEVAEFKLGSLLYFYDRDAEADNDLDRFKLAQQILPEEQFWEDCSYTTQTGRKVTDYRFDYDKIRAFLFNRGIGLYEYQPGLYRTVKREGHTVTDVSHTWIQRYVADFCDTLKDREVVKMILRGNTQYLGPNNLNYMRTHHPEWVMPNPEHQIMVFRNCFLKITAETIEQRPLTELPGTVWQNEVIDFDLEYIKKPMVQVSRGEKGWQIKNTEESRKCELMKYTSATSFLAWQKWYELKKGPDGILSYQEKKEPEALTDEDNATWQMHIATKLIAWGYKLRNYRDQSNMRAIITMDGLESQVGKSYGGSGKTIYSLATQHCQPVFTVDGKTCDLKNDRFLYHGVDERTREIVFDDVAVNFDFQTLFSQITNFIRVKPFQGAPITIPAPVFTINTNHTLRADDPSSRRRQYLLAFSSFFNEYRTPRHYFGHQLFLDWDKAEWNLYYNLMATCLQVYMQFSDLGKYQIESSDIRRRQLRQQLGEDFIEFGETYFSAGYMLNRVLQKERVLNDYLDQFPHHRKFMDVRKVKEKVELFARFANLEFNPGAKDPGGRIKSSGFEFICVADQQYNQTTAMADQVDIGTPVQKEETVGSPY